jgi:hypothetical protein
MQPKYQAFRFILLLVSIVNGINPMSVVSEAENAQVIAVDEGYKAATALGKLTDSIRPGKREVSEFKSRSNVSKL